MSRVSLRWGAYAVEEGINYSKEPATLIEFELVEAAGEILLRVSEWGFEARFP